VNLPDDFLTALEEEVGRRPDREIVEATRRLSLSYRERHGRGYGAFVHGEADACAYAAYRLPATFTALKAVFEEVRARQPGTEPATFLDVGAGPGRVSIPAAERVGASGAVVAIDVQQAMLERVRLKAAEHGLRNVRTICGAVEDLANSPELRPASFDRALLVTVLGEIPDRERAMRVIHAALRPGGVLSATEFLPDPHFQTRETVKRLGEAAGFQLDRKYGWPVAFTMNLRKPK